MIAKYFLHHPQILLLALLSCILSGIAHSMLVVLVFWLDRLRCERYIYQTMNCGCCDNHNG